MINLTGVTCIMTPIERHGRPASVRDAPACRSHLYHADIVAWPVSILARVESGIQPGVEAAS